ncbi:MAG: T9SS type A sorting domain-containing protein [Bacteroidota bacterium]
MAKNICLVKSGVRKLLCTRRLFFNYLYPSMELNKIYFPVSSSVGSRTMAKKFFLIALIIILNSAVWAQQYDNVWPLATYYSSNNIYYYLDFSSGIPDTFIYQRKMHICDTEAAMSDNSGNIQFYTNGIWIANKVNDTLYNSQNFNSGWATGNYWNTGMCFSQSALALPFNDSSKHYFLIYENAEPFYNIDNALDAQPFYLSYSVIDMSLDSGKGGIPLGFKDIRPIQDTLLLGRITACKHANGRDWWVVVHKYYSDIYYKLLFTPLGVFGPFIQQIGSVFPAKLQGGDDFDIWGMTSFSPDGNKYIMVGPSRIMQILDFDRCTGLFFNYQTANIPASPGGDTWALGCNFSPSSRYIYTNTYTRAFQYDSYASNIDSSGIVIAVYDTFLNPFDTYFFLNQLGPDGKIYLSTFNGCRVLHVINYPDSAGLSCDFSLHGFALPPNYGGNTGLPNFPNYRLGRLNGSPCDTLTAISYAESNNVELKILPNPNEGNFIIKYSLPHNRNGTLEIYNILGLKIYSLYLPEWSIMQRIDVSNLPSGIYICKLKSQDEHLVIKFMKE